ncbi:MAG: hypothetical protein JWM31_1362 [Solirubrobacterales bacterium]|nr:hypothetical protein [Solirubrobacterales bacterium]
MARLSRLVPGLCAAALIASVGAPAAEAAPGPAEVRITVEGAGRTLVPERLVTTSTGTLERGGAACSGTSAAGALEVASAGAWDGVYDPSTGLAVIAVLGESHPDAARPGRHWALTVNSVPVAGSPCGIELNQGDRVVFYASDAPAGTVAPSCRTNGRDGLCGSMDRTGPGARVTAPREQQRYRSRATSPLVVAGRVDPDPSGLADIKLRITRTSGTRCHYYSGIDETFLQAPRCGAGGPFFFSIAQHTPTWSYEMPRRFTRGRYTVDVQAVDTLGNVTEGVARGVDRIVFVVQ